MLRLTPAEKQEIIRFLEADKPLPEKYRFLLFDDKREVELVWNGKTNEVCNVVLPFQVIEQVDEPRAEAVVTIPNHQRSTTATKTRREFSSLYPSWRAGGEPEKLVQSGEELILIGLARMACIGLRGQRSWMN